jgi:hypothetical protein
MMDISFSPGSGSRFGPFLQAIKNISERNFHCSAGDVEVSENASSLPLSWRLRRE